MSASNFNLFGVCALIFLASCLITPSLGYINNDHSTAYHYPELVGGGRNYRYVSPRSSSGGSDVHNSNNRIRERRYYDPAVSSSQYPSSSVPVAKIRRRYYAVEDAGPSKPAYRQTYNELDGGYPTSRRAGSSGRWYSPTKRQAGGLGFKLDNHNRVQMGVSNSMCDDAKSNLTNDWDMSPVNYTCFHPETRFPRSFNAEPLLECERLPPRYVPGHVCMDEKIYYKDAIPTHGDHRPLWPKFGEYMFVPRERWLHNIEHGAIVMLYHPCAYPSEVDRLRNLVRGCVGKHVITPSTYVSPERPLVLVAWGCRLQMSEVDDQAVMDFIRTRAHKGPEGTYQKEGQYELMLLKSGKSSGNGLKYGYSRVTCDSVSRSRN